MEKPLVGKIHSLESFGTVDGPGIRFVTFLQGCPLRCPDYGNTDNEADNLVCIAIIRTLGMPVVLPVIK